MDNWLDQNQIVEILSTYGYWAIFILVALESSGIPLPGETILIGAAVYAGQTERFSIGLVIFAAASGAIIGDNIGYWIGREFGAGLLERHGSKLGLTPEKLRLMRYLFMRFGGWVIFFGRFITLLRVFAAVLAGANRYNAAKFMAFNASGGVVWATTFGLGGYFLSVNFHRLEGPFAIAGLLGLLAGLFFLWRFYKINEQRLIAEANALFKDQSVLGDREPGR
jgi:membrane protein DedA with SNARE-associated domain